MEDFNAATDILIKGKGKLRGKRPDAIKYAKDVIAVMGFGGSSDYEPKYQKPWLTIKSVHEWTDGTEYTNNLISLSFQRHRVDRPRDSWESESDCEFRRKQVAVSGFMIGGHRKGWGHCYAGEMSGGLGDRARLAVGLSLLDRAHAAVSNENHIRGLYRVDDELLSVVVGLRRIGVSTIVKEGRKTVRHAVVSMVA